jgi:hypothetical protein
MPQTAAYIPQNTWRTLPGKKYLHGVRAFFDNVFDAIDQLDATWKAIFWGIVIAGTVFSVAFVVFRIVPQQNAGCLVDETHENSGEYIHDEAVCYILIHRDNDGYTWTEIDQVLSARDQYLAGWGGQMTMAEYIVDELAGAQISGKSAADAQQSAVMNGAGVSGGATLSAEDVGHILWIEDSYKTFIGVEE